MKELTENMRALLRQLKNDKTVIRSYAEQNFLIVISQNKLCEKKDKLRMLCQIEVDKLLKKKQKPFAKKKKPSEDSK